MNKANFSIGEVAILQPPHPSARHLWGQETTVLSIHWNEGSEDAMGGYTAGWGYECDVSAPPPTDLPEDQDTAWLWCEYDLKKKHDPGESFEGLMSSLVGDVVEL